MKFKPQFLKGWFAIIWLAIVFGSAPKIVAATDADSDLVSWVQRSGVAIPTGEVTEADPFGGALLKGLEKVRVVAIGEASHGSEKSTELKHRIVQFLVEKAGFHLIALEGSDEGVRSSFSSPLEGDGRYYSDVLPWRLSAGQKFTNWVNGSRGKSIQEVVGLDEGDLKKDVEWIESLDGQSDFPKDLVDQALLDSLLGLRVNVPRGNLAVGYPAAEASGKRLTLHADVRGDKVTGIGWLWIRVDLLGRKMAAYADNLDLGVRGNTDWKAVSIVLDIPESATKVEWGACLSGAGKFELRNVRLQVNDLVPVDATAIAMEQIPKVSVATLKDFEIKAESEAPGVVSISARFSSGPNEAVYGKLLEISQQLRAASSTKSSSAHSPKLLRRINRLTRGVGVISGFLSRDKKMADSVLDFLRAHPGEKAIVWCHNEHAQHSFGKMGGYLREAIGGEYRSIGLVEGLTKCATFERVSQTVDSVDLPEPPMRSWENLFERSLKTITYISFAGPSPEEFKLLRPQLVQGLSRSEAPYLPRRLGMGFDDVIWIP